MTGAPGQFTEDKCRRYIEATGGRETPVLVQRAIDMVAASPEDARALELGCGAGDDAVAMLKRGFTVTVVDEMATAIEAVATLAEQNGVADRLTTHRATFADFAIEPDFFDLINARASIQFSRPVDFPEIWRQIRLALRAGGVFTGHLLGPRDSFMHDHEKSPNQITCHRPEEINAMLEGMTVHFLREIEGDGLTALGNPRHRHIHQILAQRL